MPVKADGGGGGDGKYLKKTTVKICGPLPIYYPYGSLPCGFVYVTQYTMPAYSIPENTE